MTASGQALFSCFLSFFYFIRVAVLWCMSPQGYQRGSRVACKVPVNIGKDILFLFLFREEACIWAESAGNMINTSLDFLDARVIFLYALTLLVSFLTVSPLFIYFFYFNTHYELTGLHSKVKRKPNKLNPRPWTFQHATASSVQPSLDLMMSGWLSPMAELAKNWILRKQNHLRHSREWRRKPVTVIWYYRGPLS